jgi:DNA polymerase-1
MRLNAWQLTHPIQGTAADLIKMAMIEVQKKINGLAYMTIQVHDELVLEVEKSKAEEVAEIVKKTMEEVVALRVPVKVSVSINANWGDMK